MGKTALVTGAYGFVGRHVAQLLARDGWSVTGIGHGSWAREEWQQWGIAEWHVADVTLETLTTYGGKPDVIVHCAGSGSVGFSFMYPYQDYQRTVTTTLSVLEFTRMYAPNTRVIYPSSAGVYGLVQTLPIKETAPLLPASPYGVHKRIAEELCENYANHFDVQAAVVRLFSVYGNGLRKQLLWDASQKIMRGETDFYGTGEEIRDWLHINDAARLLVTATGYASTICPVVNGGSGMGVTVRDILKELFACLQRDDEPKFSGSVRSGDPDSYVADIALAQQWMWKPKIEWRKGLRDYVEWFKSGA